MQTLLITTNPEIPRPLTLLLIIHHRALEDDNKKIELLREREPSSLLLYSTKIASIQETSTWKGLRYNWNFIP